MFTVFAIRVHDFTQGIKRRGVWQSLRKMASRKFNRWFYHRLCVWEWRQEAALIDHSLGVEIMRYDNPDQVPAGVLGELVRQDTPTFLSRMNREFADQGVLWVGLVEGAVAGYQWHRRGDLVQDWHFELTERDRVIFSVVTFPAFRGRRVAQAILSHICREEIAEDGRATAECFVWNTPSVRLFSSTGFTKVAEQKPKPNQPY